MRSQANPRLMLMILSAVFAFLYIPISVLFALSFNEGGLPTAWTGFSVKWYGELVRNDEIIGAALNTLIVAIVSTVLATILGTLLAVGVEIRRRKGRFLETIIFAPMIIPDIVLAAIDLSYVLLAAGAPNLMRSPRAVRLANRTSATAMGGAAIAIALRD